MKPGKDFEYTPSPLKLWIKAYGTEKLAAELGVSCKKIMKWLRGERPKNAEILAIVFLSRGKLTPNRVKESCDYEGAMWTKKGTLFYRRRPRTISV